MDIDGAKEEYFGRRAGGHRFRHGLSISDGSDLILIQSDDLLEKRLQVGI
jgi:hypothetical protein